MTSSVREKRIKREEAHKDKILGLLDDREKLEQKIERKNAEIAKAIEAAQQAHIGAERVGKWIGLSRPGVYMFCQRHLGGTKRERGASLFGNNNDKSAKSKDKPKIKIRRR